MADNTDTKYLITVLAVLIAINFGGVLIYQEFSGTSSQFNDNLISNSSDLSVISESSGSGTGFVLWLKALSGILAWSFGLIPAWLDLILVMIRVLGYIIVIRMIRGI